MRNILFTLLIFTLYQPQAFATACTNFNKDCVGIKAKRMFLNWTPVCVMEAECDMYCGQMKIKRGTTTLYCAFQKIDKNEYECLPAQECNDDTSLIRSDDDVRNLTNSPISPGPGLRVPRNGKID